jgi:hypothetical protein
VRLAWIVGFVTCSAGALSAQMHKHRWTVMLDGTAFVQYVHSFGTRGTYQLGSVNRAMLAAGGPWLGGSVTVRSMGSAEPLTLTARGMPQPLQVAFPEGGETVTDHAHPSPWIMELAASYERPIPGGAGMTVSLQGAAIGAPALGPPVYQHRASAAANPAVPLGHHAQDVTHASFGVVTLGLDAGRVQLEGSAFNDRQPSNSGTVFFYRGARLDAYALRATMLAGGWSLSSWYGYLPATSGAHAHDSQHRVGVAAVRSVSDWSVTIVYGSNDPLGRSRPRHTILAEGERRWSGHVVFGRVEYVQRTSQELALVGAIRETQDIGALQLGYSRKVGALRGTVARVGTYGTVNLIPRQLEPFYGSRTPLTVAAFGQVTWGSGHSASRQMVPSRPGPD